MRTKKGKLFIFIAIILLVGPALLMMVMSQRPKTQKPSPSSSTLGNTPPQETGADEKIALAYESSEKDNTLHLIQYNLTRGKSENNFFINLPSGTEFKKNDTSPGNGSWSVQFFPDGESGILEVTNSSLSTTEFYSWSKEGTNLIFSTTRSIRNWKLLEEQKQLFLLMQEPSGLREEYEIHTVSLKVASENQSQLFDILSGNTHLLDLPSSEKKLGGLSFFYHPKEKIFERVLTIFSLTGTDIQKEQKQIFSEKYAPGDSIKNISNNTQYYAVWGKNGLAIHQLLNDTVISVTDEPATDLSVLWSPTSQKIAYLPAQGGIWISDLTANTKRQIRAQAPHELLAWPSSNEVLFIDGGSLQSINTISQESTLILGEKQGGSTIQGIQMIKK